ncbi:hypothetical protein JF780_07580 [Mycobacterium intracellulare]|nr:hypothetical protein [Mycobacterium intracellulare]MCA2272451.1 hypothetical protein [Mycobacterium intracellulare]MCA2324811.1 hypothetical protein [Mycobacterium intracellulare]
MTTATTGEARVEIDAAQLAVYHLISDITRMGDWNWDLAMDCRCPHEQSA